MWRVFTVSGKNILDIEIENELPLSPKAK